MGVRPVECGKRACRGLLEAHVEQQPPLPVREELLQRLGRLAAGAGRAHLCADGEERALEVAPRRLAGPAGAEVPADGALAADLDVGDVGGARPDRRRQLHELRDRRRRADRDARPVARDACEPGAASAEHRASGRSLP